jgi:hypothetical protein
MPVIGPNRRGIRRGRLGVQLDVVSQWHPAGSGSRAAGRGPAAAPNFKLLEADGTQAATHVPASGVSRLVRRARPVAP